jgi:transposase InsO family protein
VGSVGEAYENSMAESFVSTLKRELIHRHSWPTPQSARVAIFFEYIAKRSTTSEEGTPPWVKQALPSTRKLQ